MEERALVVGRNHRDGLDAELSAGAKDAHGDLPAVGYEQLADRHVGSLWTAAVRYRHSMRALGLRLLLSLGANAVAFIICAALLDGFDLGGADFVWAVIIFSLVNWLVPLIVLAAFRRQRAASLGLILLLANAATLLVTDWISGGIDISGTGTLVAATVII